MGKKSSSKGSKVEAMVAPSQDAVPMVSDEKPETVAGGGGLPPAVPGPISLSVERCMAAGSLRVSLVDERCANAYALGMPIGKAGRSFDLGDIPERERVPMLEHALASQVVRVEIVG